MSYGDSVPVPQASMYALRSCSKGKHLTNLKSNTNRGSFKLVSGSESLVLEAILLQGIMHLSCRLTG